MKVWAKTEEFKEGKFLVVRRDGSVPHWPHFVLGARDPAAPLALRCYADKAAVLGMDPEYVASIRQLANDFEAYAKEHGPGDPPAAPHRKDNPVVLAAMRGEHAVITVRPDKSNAPKDPPLPEVKTVAFGDHPADKLARDLGIDGTDIQVGPPSVALTTEQAQKRYGVTMTAPPEDDADFDWGPSEEAALREAKRAEEEG